MPYARPRKAIAIRWEMSWDAAMNFAMAKELELVQRQNDAFRKEGIQDF